MKPTLQILIFIISSTIFLIFSLNTALGQTTSAECGVDSRVDVSSAWFSEVGYLIGDNKTVLVYEDFFLRRKNFSVTTRGKKEVTAEVIEIKLIRHKLDKFIILKLDQELPGTPLQLAPAQGEIDEEILVSRQTRDVQFPIEQVRTKIISRSESVYQLPVPYHRFHPVFNLSCKLMAFTTG